MDLILCFSHQTLCHRLVLLFNQTDFPFFPPDFADEVRRTTGAL
jgi:hypothetical protein